MAQDRHGAAAIAAREAEITGKPQRIGEVAPETLDGEALALINRVRASAGSGPAAHIPGYFLTMIKHPGIFRGQLELGTTIFRGALPARERELAVLRVGWLCRAPYEWGEHVDIGKRCGLSADEVARIQQGSAAPGWSRHDRAILAAVEELLDDQMIGDDTWAVLAESWTEVQLIEFPMMIGQYVATAYVQNTLRIRLAEDNPGLTYR
ncbi:MAG: carboxymuconolactone decarboxylase family protein [Sphingomonadales bacterium]|nr:carboxymuconolactone decarboxylase family protein [Sphingomonadales bacterium]